MVVSRATLPQSGLRKGCRPSARNSEIIHSSLFCRPNQMKLLLGCGAERNRCFSESKTEGDSLRARPAPYSLVQTKFKASSVLPEPLYFAT